MKFESAPINLGTASFDGNEVALYAIAIAMFVLVIFGVRRELALFAVFAGLLGLVLTN